MFSERERYLLNKIIEKIDHIESVPQHYGASVIKALEDPV